MIRLGAKISQIGKKSFVCFFSNEPKKDYYKILGVQKSASMY